MAAVTALSASRSIALLSVVIALLALASGIQTLPALGTSPGGVTERVSVDSQGGEADDASFEASISGDGRYVAFASVATNLVEGDTNGLTDVFRRDVISGETLRISENSLAAGGDAQSFSPDISDDGQAVVFVSRAINLLASGPASVALHSKVFLWLLEGDEVNLRDVIVGSEGDPANGDSSCPETAESDDGRYFAFYSLADNLAENAGPGIYVTNWDTGETWFLDAVPDSCGLAFSADGGRLAWAEDGKVFEWDLETNDVTAVPGPPGGAGGRSPHAGPAGVVPDGDSSDPSISGDGRYVAFRSFATNLVPGDTNGRSDIFVYDLATTETTRVSLNSEGVQGNGTSRDPSISGGGRFVSFSSSSSNLVPGDTNGFHDIFVHDRQTGETVRVSVNPDGVGGDAHTFESAISANGRVVAFQSPAANLVPGDTNGKTDVFIHTLPPPPLPEGLEQGDIDCQNGVNAVDSLTLLRNSAGLGVTQAEGCPEIGSEVASLFGDVDCDDDVDAVDALKILRSVAAFSVSQNEPCTDIGDPF